MASSKTRVTTLSVAQAEGISEKMLERIAAKLKKEGFVKSTKGAGGGYELALPPNEITVTALLMCMETPYLPHHCVEDYESCLLYKGCTTIKLWEDIDNAIRSVTDNVTIESLSHCGGGEGAEPPIIPRFSPWQR